MHKFVSLPLSASGGKSLVVPALGKYRAHIVGHFIRCENEGTRLRWYSANDDTAEPCSGEFVYAQNEVDDRLITGPVDAQPAPLISGRDNEGLEVKIFSGKAALNGVVQVWYEPLV